MAAGVKFITHEDVLEFLPISAAGTFKNKIISSWRSAQFPRSLPDPFDSYSSLLWENNTWNSYIPEVYWLPKISYSTSLLYFCLTVHIAKPKHGLLIYKIESRYLNPASGDAVCISSCLLSTRLQHFLALLKNNQWPRTYNTTLSSVENTWGFRQRVLYMKIYYKIDSWWF